MKTPRFNPFFHDEESSGNHGFNWALVGAMVLGIIVWGAALWVAYRGIRGGR